MVFQDNIRPLIQRGFLLLMLVVQMTAQAAIAQQSLSTITHFPAAANAIEATGFYGALLLYDETTGRWLASHPERIDRPLLPASTFKIVSALVALESGVIAGPSTVIPWDNVVRGRPETNRDLDLQSAFRISAVPHFQHLVRQVGHARMQRYVDKAAYGNETITGGEDTFWLTGDLRITARQQIQFLRALHSGELPFGSGSMTAVRQMMLTEETESYAIHAKTGWATPEGEEDTGWWVGWLERKGQVYFFAAFLQADGPGEDFGPARLDVVRTTFSQMGLLD